MVQCRGCSTRKSKKLPPADGKHQGVVKDIPIIREEIPPEGRRSWDSGDGGQATKPKHWQTHCPQLVITGYVLYSHAMSYPPTGIEQDYASFSCALCDFTF